MSVRSLVWKTLYLVAGLYATLMLVVAIDADTGEPPSCVGCVVPAPHAWEVKGTP